MTPPAVVIAALLPVALPQEASQAASEYFQQDVSYTLEVRLDEDRDLLVGAGVVTYQNKSSQSLDSLYFHLYLNASAGIPPGRPPNGATTSTSRGWTNGRPPSTG